MFVLGWLGKVQRNQNLCMEHNKWISGVLILNEAKENGFQIKQNFTQSCLFKIKISNAP